MQNGRITIGELGMTLIEIMVVLAIIGLLVGGVGIYAMKAFGDSQEKVTRQRIEHIRGALGIYALNHGSACPQSLGELRTKEIITKAPNDGWDREIVFECENGKPVLHSVGRDGRDGTEDDIREPR
jgi:general secretion pathway protein G